VPGRAAGRALTVGGGVPEVGLGRVVEDGPDAAGLEEGGGAADPLDPLPRSELGVEGAPDGRVRQALAQRRLGEADEGGRVADEGADLAGLEDGERLEELRGRVVRVRGRLARLLVRLRAADHVEEGRGRGRPGVAGGGGGAGGLGLDGGVGDVGEAAGRRARGGGVQGGAVPEGPGAEGEQRPGGGGGLRRAAGVSAGVAGPDRGKGGSEGLCECRRRGLGRSFGWLGLWGGK